MAFLARSPRLTAVLLLAGACVAGGAALRAQPQTVPIEENVKAVFLYNFAKYVTWPPVALGERSPAEVRICVTANDVFFGLLQGAVQGETIDGKPLVPVALDGLDDARTCQILYVRDAHTADARAWLNAVRGAQVLTVGDGPLNDETVITFVRDQNRIRFDVNRAAGNRHRLNVSSKLLRLARQVRER
jgi:hypothetical protein